MPYCRSDNIWLYYDDVGSGESIIFLHGFSLDRTMWYPQINYFKDNYRVITADARGHGRSGAPSTGYAREDRARDVLVLADYLHLEKFHLVGLSMGGGDALSFAIDYPDRLITLTLAATVISGRKPPKKFRDFRDVAREKGVEQARREWIKASLTNYAKRQPELKKFLENIMNGFSGEPWRDPMIGKYEKRDDIEFVSQVKIPTQIMVGQHDIFFRPLAEDLHKRMTGSGLEIIPGAGHMVNLEAPDKFNEILKYFLQQNNKYNK
jgi:3-oxoadipate enol-lactonase